MKKRKLQINLSNKTFYTLLLIGALILFGVGVYAVAGVSHDASEITEADPTVLASVKDGIAWSEISSIPAGFLDGVDNYEANTNADTICSGSNVLTGDGSCVANYDGWRPVGGNICYCVRCNGSEECAPFGSEAAVRGDCKYGIRIKLYSC